MVFAESIIRITEGTMTKTVWVGLIIIALLVGLFIGYCIWTSTWTMPQALKYDLFKDILTIVLAVLAVGITVIGYGIYLILSERLKTESAGKGPRASIPSPQASFTAGAISSISSEPNNPPSPAWGLSAATAMRGRLMPHR